MSGSPEAVTAAMARYADIPRTVIALRAMASRLVDLRGSGWQALGGDPAQREGDWMASLARDEEPVSWRVADRARAAGADGLIDASRHLPGGVHLVLFGWNDGGGASVEIVGST